MNPTIDEFFLIWQDLDNNELARDYFKERDRHDLRIKDVTIDFRPKGDKVEARMEVNYSDPEAKQPNEDLTIIMELNGKRWGVKSITETKL
jgi:hypothetical protein